MKPMKAVAADFNRLKFPLYASVKLDGIRAVIVDGVVKSNTMKPLPNKHIQSLLGDPFLNGLDGELTIGDPSAQDVMQKTSSGVMSQQGTPHFMFNVFDFFTDLRAPYAQRYEVMKKGFDNGAFPFYIQLLPQQLIRDLSELNAFETQCLRNGYEGVMVRSLDGVYKFGRSTVNEGYLLKVKRFEDAEAVIIGAKELMHNNNEAVINGIGLAKRPTSKDGLQPSGLLGALIVKDILTGIEFDVGTGFTELSRLLLWDNFLRGENLLGRTITYKHFAQTGVKDKPRMPVFKGFRDPIDM